MAKKHGAYLEDKGADRATVIIDKQGVVRYAASVTPAGNVTRKNCWRSARKSIKADVPAMNFTLQR
jgi:peroxiredoxin